MIIKQVDSRGRVGIPAELRRRLGLKAGTRVAFVEGEQSVEVRVVDRSYFDSAAGAPGLRGKHLKSLMKRK